MNYKKGFFRTFIVLTALTGLLGSYFEGLHFVPLILINGEEYAEVLTSKINNEMKFKPECATAELHSNNNTGNSAVINLVVIPDNTEKVFKVIDCPSILEFADLSFAINPKNTPTKIIKSEELTAEFIKEHYTSAYNSARLNRVFTSLKNGLKAIEYLWLIIGFFVAILITIRWIQKGFGK